MDGSAAEHSDSDSGESWTLLENNSSFEDDAPENEMISTSYEREHSDVHNDEDTDGISIISDSDPESAACDLTTHRCLSQENRPSPQLDTSYILAETLNNQQKIDNIVQENQNDYLHDNNIKHRTYVHRRNKRLSTMLNIIMLGSVITAAGVAIGHMWGAKYECNMHTASSVNKILSSLYKLKEENAFLRNKLKELTMVNNIHLQQRANEKMQPKQQRCKKMFEEPLNKRTEKGFKCIDVDKSELLDNIAESPEHEREFAENIEKMRHIYNENKSWLNAEIENHMKIYGNNLMSRNRNPKKTLSHKSINLNKQPKLNNEPEKVTVDIIDTLTAPYDIDMTVKRVTYADSLKSEPPAKKQKTNDTIEMPVIRVNNHVNKKKPKAVNDDNILLNNSYIEEDIKKDDRYTAPRVKQERKKYDRQKMHKKQKRKNKYEQWEMKGGYLKDYDEFSVTSSLGNVVTKNMNKKLNPDFEIYINKFTETDVEQKSKKNDEKKHPEKRASNKEKKERRKDLDWFEKRSAMRNEARKKLEYELFGETTPNAASWYFRRMQKREQCRAQKDNGTFKKFFKQKLNFKIKH